MGIKPLGHKSDNRRKATGDHGRIDESDDKHTSVIDPLHYRASSIFAGFESASMRAALALGMMLAEDGDIPVLIEGESGTGKSRLARLIHDMSPHAGGPFVCVNAAAIPDGLVASELFGHELGAFTGAVEQRIGKIELAHKGTLFIDEIGKAPLEVQLKLLAFIEDQLISRVGAERDLAVDVRIVVATNSSLEKLVAAGTFLPDLAARLETFLITLPPLRERALDLPQLARHYIARHRERRWPHHPLPTIHPELMVALCRAPWKNNLRQLENQLILILSYAQCGPVLSLEHCQGKVLAYLRELRDVRKPVTVADFEAMMLEFKTKQAAAAACGVDRKTFRRWHRLAR